MTLFSDVKKAVSVNSDVILRGLGLNLVGRAKGDWTPVVCPLCDDSGGSASVTPQGFLHCHQCNQKLDLFQWMSQRDHLQPYEIAKKIAESLNVPLKAPAKAAASRNMPVRMTEELLDEAIDDLWSAKAAKPCRDFLAERKLDSDPVLLGELGVGFLRGYIIFAQRDHNGKIQDRYRGYLPGGQLKWQWFGRGFGGPGIWGANRQVGKRILLLEGEWDALTAILRLHVERGGDWLVATWTAGASSSPSLGDIPKTWKGKDIYICYDNDVFQGANFATYWAKDVKGEQKLLALRKNLLGKVAPTFRDAGLTVWIKQIPITPQEIWGGDFRDWVNKGGTDPDSLPTFKFEALPSVTTDEQVLDFDELWEGHSGERIKTRTQVSLIAGDDYFWPTLCQLKCQLGQLNCCNACGAPKLFPDGFVPMDQFSEQIAIGIAEQDLEGYLLKHVVKRPKSCPEARLTTVEGKAASHWKGMRPGSGDDTRQRSLSVVSTQPPSLSGEVDISGVLHSHGSSFVFMADQVYQLDRAEVDLSGIDIHLRQLCPYEADTIEQIDNYLDDRWRDISKHVTRVHGRRDIHVACELLFHSVAGIAIGGKVRRGWLDAALIGDTRTGKSLTVRGFIEWLRLGSIHSAVDNVSRAGLIMGSDHHGMLRPGLMTKSHRKLLAVDEFHWLVSSRRLGDDHPMSWLQSARDEGKVYGIKIYGDRALPAKVRLMTISNWAKSQRRSFAYACEHLSWVYGSPETLSRLDFGLVVEGPPSQSDFDDVRSVWSVDYAKPLVLRAWAMEPSQVRLDKDAEELAFWISDSWKHLYHYEKLPLYTPEEKPFSIIRIATAVANLCFSHPKDDPYCVAVKPVHVQWAANWLRHVWNVCEYDTYSTSIMADNVVEAPFAIERLLTVQLRLDDPNSAPRILGILMKGVNARDDAMLLGLVSDADKVQFFGKGAKINCFLPGRGEEKGMTLLTPIAHDIAMRLSRLARECPDEYMDRYRRLSQFTGHVTEQLGLTPIHLEGA